MKYLSPSFSIPPPETLEGITCEACVYGTKRGEKHAPGCRMRPLFTPEQAAEWDRLRREGGPCRVPMYGTIVSPE